MVKRFHRELEKLKVDVLKMGSLATEMLCTSVQSLVDLDTETAKKVMNNKKKLAQYNIKLEEEALKIIALYQPMAKDMRTIACILKMIIALNRIGRYGKDIAKVVGDIGQGPHIKKIVSIPHMNQIVCKMINDAFTAFSTNDLTVIKDFSERDDDVDHLRYSIFRECISYMMEDPKYITICSHYILIARYLERCGDHACDMGEEIYYMVTGKRTELH